MPFIIETIARDSLAEQIGLQIHDAILTINGNPIRDFLDLQFFGADQTLTIEWRRNNQVFTKTITQNYNIPLGVEGNEHHCRTCINDCIFCFIDQMHPKLRQSLYLKDDDVPFSFVFGNFITLTNLTEQDYERIIRQKLSPLYISVHTTNLQLHKAMLRHPLTDFSILERLHFLSKHEIQFHTQIVLVPGYNDGEELKKTLENLTNPELETLSIGVVPVGLTKFRKNLSLLKPVSRTQAKEIVTLCEQYYQTYLADEFFLLAGLPLPEDEYYDDYPQLENGIGMLRMLLENWRDVKTDFIDDLKENGKSPVFVTGILAAPFLKKIALEIEEESGIPARVQSIKNTFFGESVTVGGLLTAQDILAQTQISESEILCLSSNLFNADMKTLDNVSVDSLYNHFGNRLILIDEEFADWEFWGE